jgi:hypothetical protein
MIVSGGLFERQLQSGGRCCHAQLKQGSDQSLRTNEELANGTLWQGGMNAVSRRFVCQALADMQKKG